MPVPVAALKRPQWGFQSVSGNLLLSPFLLGKMAFLVQRIVIPDQHREGLQILSDLVNVDFCVGLFPAPDHKFYQSVKSDMEEKATSGDHLLLESGLQSDHWLVAASAQRQVARGQGRITSSVGSEGTHSRQLIVQPLQCIRGIR
ncbi:hypothetical protein CEXT_12191 [Caerostris extrusa]|uniref:Uncharacterized protein n=1 Tax=Caerostris extrusa TaxID=172846 RepID=A0AAV4SNF1_CAEEX|nr:hypothetical protein CEXT_12191 [Caerostris extrusa]